MTKTIDELISARSFGPEEISAIIEAFNGLCRDLGLKSHTDPLTALVVRSLLFAARQDASDAQELRERTLRGLRQ